GQGRPTTYVGAGDAMQCCSLPAFEESRLQLRRYGSVRRALEADPDPDHAPGLADSGSLGIVRRGAARQHRALRVPPS
ncbi:hypothetical protein ACFWX8_37410, partial [Streptomyces violascens]